MVDPINILQRYQELLIPIYKKMPGYNASSDTQLIQNFLDLLKTETNPFDRSCLKAHFTGSAYVCHESFESILMMHHKKLNKWLQLGGHADGEQDLSNVAMREAYEESGLQSIKHLPIQGLIIPFDLDIHHIPENRKEPQHKHYDMSFLFVAEGDLIKGNDESNDLRWVKFQEVIELTQELSIQRQLKKLQFLKSNNFLSNPNTPRSSRQALT